VAPLAGSALPGFAAALLVMALSYALSYRRRFASVLEGGGRPSERRIFAAALGLLDLFSFGAVGFERACHRFAVRALLRNETHRLCIAVAAGLGWVLGAQAASGTSELSRLSAPLIAAYLLILGLRIAFDLPAGLAANWIFRAVLDWRANEALPAARRVMLSFLIPLVLLPTFAIAWWRWSPAVAALQTLYVTAVSVCLIEILLFGYRKIPLTCPMPGFRENLVALCLIHFLGFELFTQFGAFVEAEMLRKPWWFLAIPAVLYGGWRWNRKRIEHAREDGELEEGLTFDSIPAPTVERLDLFDAQ
jgi:hypothetical protein